MVCQAGGYYDKKPFKAGRGVTQGGPLSPRVFNIMVDAIIREWLRREVGIEAAQKGLGKKCSEFLAEFYADDGIIANREPERLQQSLDALVALFERVGLSLTLKRPR